MGKAPDQKDKESHGCSLLGCLGAILLGSIGSAIILPWFTSTNEDCAGQELISSYPNCVGYTKSMREYYKNLESNGKWPSGLIEKAKKIDELCKDARPDGKVVYKNMYRVNQDVEIDCYLDTPDEKDAL